MHGMTLQLVNVFDDYQALLWICSDADFQYLDAAWYDAI